MAVETSDGAEQPPQVAQDDAGGTGMTRQEYEYLQEDLSKLLNKRLWCSKNEEQGYRNGVLAAKSKLKEVFYAQQEVQE